jgi:hypothetical protein
LSKKIKIRKRDAVPLISLRTTMQLKLYGVFVNRQGNGGKDQWENDLFMKK